MTTASKIAIAAGIALLFPVLLVAAAAGAVSGLLGTDDAHPPSQTALSDIPADYFDLYQQAAGICPGLDWTVLAAVGKIESDHGRSTLPGVHSGQNQAGAGGPLQILQPTWNGILARHRIPPGGADPPSRYNLHDAVYAAAYYLCDNGAAHDLQAAIFAYNHSGRYVADVLAQAARYTDQATAGPVECPAPAPASSRAAAGSGTAADAAVVAVMFACAQLGRPYAWGGDGDPGFDCSGLTHAAYAAAGIDLPRTAQTQYDTGPLLPPDTPLQPGDLIFFGTASRIHHVGISLGGIRMIDAPDFGQTVKVEDLRTFPDYAGATRPLDM